MSTDDTKATDILGLKPYGEAIKIVAQGAVDGAGAFLGRICLPAAEEYGLFLREKVSQWRQANTVAILSDAEQRLSTRPDYAEAHAHPRVVAEIIEKGSWCDSTEVQSMWAGLLASACTPSGRDQSNLVFVDLLGRISSSEAALLNALAAKCPVMITASGLLVTGNVVIPLDGLEQITGITDKHAQDRELDHLVSLGLLGAASGMSIKSPTANIRLTTIALQLYAASNGCSADIEEFFRERIEPFDQDRVGPSFLATS